MTTLYGWTAKRAGGAITVTHSAGKVAGITQIEPMRHETKGWIVVATRDDGMKYELGIG